MAAWSRPELGLIRALPWGDARAGARPGGLRVLVAVLLGVVPRLVAAAPLTFEGAVQAALDGSPGLVVVEAEARRAVADAQLVAASPSGPRVSAEARSDEREILLAVPLDLGVLALRGAVHPAVDAAEVRRRAARATIAAVAGAAWLDARRAQERAAILGWASGEAQGLAENASALLAVGELTADQAALLRADAARLLDRALSAELEGRAALRRLEALLGLQIQGRAELGDWPTIPEAPPAEPVALPTVVAAELDARAALARARAAHIGLLPALEVGGGWAFAADSGPIGTLSVELPLFVGSGARSSAAHAEADAASALRHQAELDANVLIEAARDEAEAARRVAAAWATINLAATRDAPRRRFEVGELSLPDYLAERDLVASALSDAIDARWRLERARLALWELAGQTPPVPY